MIKSFLLNNLLVPLRQISAPMLLASAALHSLLFVVPIPSNSTDAKASNSGDADAPGTEEVSNRDELCDEDGYLIDKTREDALNEDASLTDDIGEDSLSEDASLADETGEDFLGEDASLADEIGEDSLGEDASLADEAGEDSLSEDISLSDNIGEDSLSEDASLADETGEESLGEDASLADETGEDSLGEDISLSDNIEEEVGDEDNATPKSAQELCEKENSLPKGKSVKVPGEIPLLNGSGEGSDSEDVEEGDNETPDLSLDEPNDSIDDISSNQEEIEDALDLPSESSDISVSEPESETEIAFTPSQSLDETIDDTVSEPVDETIDDTVSEPVDETIDDTVSEPEEIAESESTNTTTESNSEEPTSESNNQPQESPINPFADFPKYIGVKPNFCGAQSARIDRRTRRTSDSLDAVQAYFEQKLADTNFQVEKLADKSDTKVYQVSKGNLTQYLQLFAVKEQGTMILLSSQRIDCYRLSNENQPAESKTEEQAFDSTLRQLYAQLGWTEETKEENFAENYEVESIFGKDTNNTPEELALLVKSKLESEGFEASQVTDETSGLLYEVKKGDFSKYISFIATKEGKGVIILALKNSSS